MVKTQKYLGSGKQKRNFLNKRFILLVQYKPRLSHFQLDEIVDIKYRMIISRFNSKFFHDFMQTFLFEDRNTSNQLVSDILSLFLLKMRNYFFEKSVFDQPGLVKHNN